MAADADALAKGQVRQSGAALRLHPSVRFSWLSTPAMSIWLAHRQPIGSDIAPEWKAEGALFARPKPMVMHTPRIGRAAHRLLFGIRLGETLDGAMNAAAKLYPEEDCTAVLSSLLNLGVFVAPPSERTD
jgi:hypothetical protein